MASNFRQRRHHVQSNWVFENPVPWFHPTSARSAGYGLHVQVHLGPGWQIRMHVYTFWHLMELLKAKYAKLWKEQRVALIPNGDVNLQNDTNETIQQLGFGGSVHRPDLSVLLETTPERARIVNDTIWILLTNHPYTNVE